MIVYNKHIIHTYFKQLTCTPLYNDKLDLLLLAKEIKLDVYFNEDKTLLLQKKSDPEGNNKEIIVDQAFEICSTRSKNKKMNQIIPKGFTKVAFASSSIQMEYNNPPPFIPIGTYCKICKNVGPNTHSYNCKSPIKSAIYLTYYGLLRFFEEVYDNEKDIELKNVLYKFSLLLKKYNLTKRSINDNESTSNKSDITFTTKISTPYKKEYIWDNDLGITILEEFKRIDEYNYNILMRSYINDKSKKIINKIIDRYEDIPTNISLSNIFEIPKKDSKGFFTGPVLLTYTTESDKSVTIRILADGTISIISNPIDDQYLYEKILNKINETSQKIKLISKDVRTLFSSVLILDNNSKFINIKKLFEYLWPLDINQNHIIKFPKEQLVTNQGTFNIIRSIEDTNIAFRYSIDIDRYEKRMYITFININQFNQSGPYKIVMQLYSQGHAQFTFCYTTNLDKTDLTGEIVVNDSFEVKLENINNAILKVQKLLIEHLLYLEKLDIKNNVNIENQILINNDVKFISKNMYPTILGILPYAKRKKFKIGDKMHIFDHHNMIWNKTPATIINIVEYDEEIIYHLQYKHKVIRRTHTSIRRIDPNNDQVCRIKDNNGIPNCPKPYSFYGECEGGYLQYISPLGVNSRSDNRFYPCCEDITKDSEKWLINFILNGFTDEEIYKYNIYPDNNNYDKYTGTLDHQCVEIGSIIHAKINGQYEEVKIINKHKTHGYGTDNNKVIYDVQIYNEDDNDKNIISNKKFNKLSQDIQITGLNFHWKYIEQRYFIGLSKLPKDQQFNILLNVAKQINILYDYNTYQNHLQYNIINHDDILDEYDIYELHEYNILDILKHNFNVIKINKNYDTYNFVIIKLINNNIYYINNNHEYYCTYQDNNNNNLNFTIIGILKNNIFTPITSLNIELKNINKYKSIFNKLNLIYNNAFFINSSDKIDVINHLRECNIYNYYFINNDKKIIYYYNCDYDFFFNYGTIIKQSTVGINEHIMFSDNILHGYNIGTHIGFKINLMKDNILHPFIKLYNIHIINNNKLLKNAYNRYLYKMYKLNKEILLSGLWKFSNIHKEIILKIENNKITYDILSIL